MKIGNIDLILAFLFITLEQLIVGFSTYSTIKIANFAIVGDRDKMIIYLIFFIASLVIVYIPGIIAKYFAIRSRFTGFKSYIFYYKKNYFNSPFLLNNIQHLNKIKGFFVNEGVNGIFQFNNFLLDVYSLSLNIAINILVIGVLIDNKIIPMYFLGFPLILLIYIRSKKKIENIAVEVQKANMDFLQKSSEAPSIIVSGNTYHYNKWEKNFYSSFDKIVKKSEHEMFFLESITNLSFLLTILPVFVRIVIIFLHSDINIVIALLATLPRQTQIMQYLNEILNYITNFKKLKTRLAGILQAVQKDKSLGKGEIDFEKINFHYNDTDVSFSDFETAFDYIREVKTGRITLRGNNGSGKSTLLFLIKRELKDVALYFSPTIDFMTTLNRQLNYSTGELLKIELSEVVDNSDAHFLLLDEWDANLDGENLDTINRLIDTVSRNKVIVEVRHRGSN